MHSHPERASLRGPRAVVLFVALAAYCHTAKGGFVTLDDKALVLENPFIKGLSWRHVSATITQPVSGTFLPVRFLSYAIDYRFWGSDAAGYHLHNAVLHGIGVVVLLSLLSRVLVTVLSRPDARLAAYGASLWFAVHPIHVECVAWISGRKDVLATVFVLLGLRCAISGRLWGHAFGLLFFLLGLGSKATAITFPVLLIMLEVSGRPPGSRTSWRRALLVHGPYVAVMLGAGWLHLRHGIESGAVEARAPVLTQRLSLSVACVGRYVWALAVPAALRLRYGPPSDAWRCVALALAVIVVVVLLRARAGRRTCALLGLGWACVNWLPVSGVLVPIGTPLAERYLRLPSIGAALFVAPLILPAARRRTVAFLGLAYAATTILGASTIMRGFVWHSTYSLLGDAARKAPAIGRNYAGLGNAYLEDGRLAPALREYGKALRHNPALPRALHNMGIVCYRMGRFEEALEFLQRAVPLNPKEPGYSNVGLVFEALGQRENALAAFRQAMRTEPFSPHAHQNMGALFMREGRSEEAIAAYERAVAVAPDAGDAHLGLGKALVIVRRYDEAARHFALAARYGPHFAEAEACLGVILEMHGKHQEAAECLQRAMFMDPTVWQGLYLAGLIAENGGDLRAALQWYERVARADPSGTDASGRIKAIRRKLSSSQ